MPRKDISFYSKSLETGTVSYWKKWKDFTKRNKHLYGNTKEYSVGQTILSTLSGNRSKNSIKYLGYVYGYTRAQVEANYDIAINIVPEKTGPKVKWDAIYAFNLTEDKASGRFLTLSSLVQLTKVTKPTLVNVIAGRRKSAKGFALADSKEGLLSIVNKYRVGNGRTVKACWSKEELEAFDEEHLQYRDDIKSIDSLYG